MKPAYTPRVQRSYVGQYRPRIDGIEKASGRAKYAGDLMVKCRVPGILYAKVLRSPFPHARIRSLDVSQAAHLRGVVDILTFEDPGCRLPKVDKRRLDRWCGHPLLRTHDVATLP